MLWTCAMYHKGAFWLLVARTPILVHMMVNIALAYLIGEQRTLPDERVVLFETKDMHHDKEDVLAVVALDKIWARALRMTADSDVKHCAQEAMQSSCVIWAMTQMMY